MKFWIGLCLVVLCIGSAKAEHTIDILDAQCAADIFNLTQKLMT